MTVLKNIIKDRILQITIIITIISLFFARPHIQDINFHTLYSITAMLTLIQIFAYLHVLDILAYKLTSIADNTRKLTFLFTILSVISAMFLTNDITVLTLVPLYLNIAKKYKLPQIVPVTLIGMGANIGAAFTPWGNPHNIFIVSHYHVEPVTFFKWSTPYLIAALLLLCGIFLLVKKEDIPTAATQAVKISWPPTIMAILVFIFFFFGIFQVIPGYWPAIVAIALALFINPKIMLKFDYSLLLTFTGFFIFVSDIRQIPLITNLIHDAVYSEIAAYLTSIVSSQFMSNVPSTILVGKFTTYAKALLLGSNIGGFGSPVGSMANMLVLKTFNENATIKKGKFFKEWICMQFIGLIILTILGWIIIKLNL